MNMDKRIYEVILILIVAALTACNSEEKIEGYKSHEILIVTLVIEDKIDIEKITLNSSYGQLSDSILRNEIGNKKTIKLKCPQIGEGTYSICVYAHKDTFCSK